MTSGIFAQNFGKQGYTLLEAAPWKHDVEDIKIAITDAMKADGVKIIRETDGVTPRSLANPHHVNALLGSIAHDKAIATIAADLLGSDVYVFQLGINLKQPLSGDIWYWHRDFPTYHHQDHIPENRMVNVLIYLDDFNRDNGSFMVVPGSHEAKSEHGAMSGMGTSHTLYYAGRDEIAEAVQLNGISFLDGAAGSVVFMNTNLLHGSGANLSASPRRLITLTLNAIDNKATCRSNRPELVDDDRPATGILFGGVAQPQKGKAEAVAPR